MTDTEHHLAAIAAAFGPSARLLAEAAVEHAVAAEGLRWLDHINRTEKGASDDVREALKAVVVAAIEDGEL